MLTFSATLLESAAQEASADELAELIQMLNSVLVLKVVRDSTPTNSAASKGDRPRPRAVPASSAPAPVPVPAAAAVPEKKKALTMCCRCHNANKNAPCDKAETPVGSGHCGNHKKSSQVYEVTPMS